jgi:hypothetical protein
LPAARSLKVAAVVVAALVVALLAEAPPAVLREGQQAPGLQPAARQRRVGRP